MIYVLLEVGGRKIKEVSGREFQAKYRGSLVSLNRAFQLDTGSVQALNGEAVFLIMMTIDEGSGI